MSPLPVIADTFRVSFVFEADGGVAPVNVFHVATATTDVADIADAIDDALDNNMYAPMSAAFNLGTINVLPLDGTSATYSKVPENGVSGLGSGDWVPEAAAVVSMRTAQRGPRGRGRVFIGPVSEDALTNGQLHGDALLLPVPAWQDFTDALNGSDIGMVVASYAHADQHLVTNFVLSSHYGTQRRRLTSQR